MRTATPSVVKKFFRPAFICPDRNANTGAGQDLTGLAAAVQLRLRVASLFRVASIAVMQRSLKPQSTGRHRGDPPVSRMKNG